MIMEGPTLKQHNGIGAVIAALNEAPLELPDTAQVPGIYVLFNAMEAVYIGMTTVGRTRVNQHVGQKVFTHYRFLPLPGLSKSDLCAIESILISLYRPALNRLTNEDKRFARFAEAIRNLENALGNGN